VRRYVGVQRLERLAQKGEERARKLGIREEDVPTGNFTEEGRKRLAEAMKRRWAVKRATAKKAGGKKAA
jgi:hypothetical protein